MQRCATVHNTAAKTLTELLAAPMSALAAIYDFVDVLGTALAASGIWRV